MVPLLRDFSFLRNMALPYFFVEDLSGASFQMDEDSSKHMISVLRMKNGDMIRLTDGKGNTAEAMIADDNRKRCMVSIDSRMVEEPKSSRTSIAISLLKNSSRFEWFLEKATEIGVSEIIPLLCERTITEKFRYDRMKQIVISAMLQSQQCWLPELHEPLPYQKMVTRPYDQKFIAWCEEKEQSLPHLPTKATQVVLIGPEGDFTRAEVELAGLNGFQPVSLGKTRLRTETAGMVAATLLCLSS